MWSSKNKKNATTKSEAILKQRTATPFQEMEFDLIKKYDFLNWIA